MGIRFHCPNGHKLNVKSFLAGKKGVCPDCGVKLRIPDRSEPRLDSGIDEGKQIASLPQQVPATPAPAVNPPPAVAAPVVVAPVRPVTAPMPVPMPVPVPQPAMAQPAYVPPPPQPVRAAMAQPIGYGAQPAAIPPFTPPAGPIMPPPPPPMAGVASGVAADPIAENPLATWFVRPPSGGQFGPARGEVMRKWLTEGRVTSDSLVWREGWVDWLAATEVFPSLGKPAPTPLFGIQPAGPKTAAAVPAAGKKQSSAMSAAILAMLAVICLVLVGVLAVLLSGGFGST